MADTSAAQNRGESERTLIRTAQALQAANRTVLLRRELEDRVIERVRRVL